MSNLTRSAVNVFAVIENFREGSSDILAGLMPFFEPILQENRGLVFDPLEFAAEVRRVYKWNFTSDIAEEFVPRFQELGWIKLDDEKRPNGPFTVSISEREPTEKEQEILARFDEIATEFKRFSESLSPLTALNSDVSHYKDMLIEWLLYVDAYSEDNLDFSVQAEQDETGKISQRVNIPNTTSLKSDERYLCAKFAEYAIKTNSDVARTLCQIASIGLLTEVVQDFNKPTSSIIKSDLIIYLDAPIAMEFLGVSGRAAQENIAPIVDELQNIGIQIRVFSQSLSEITSNLNAVLKATNRTGPTARALAQGSVLESFVRSVADDPERSLETKGVSVTYRELDQFPNEINYFDKGRYDELYAGLTFQQNTRAREHDTTVATFIMRMRKGSGSRDVFGSMFLLLTRNGIFAQQSRRVCADLAAMNPNDVGPVIHRRFLATAIWLRTGMSSNRDQIPKRQLLASCERILSLKPDVVRAVKKFSDALNPEKAEQLDLLLAKDRSSQMLMDKTLGASKIISSENISLLFDEMISPYLAEKDEEHKNSIEAVKVAERAKTKEQKSIAEKERNLSKATNDALLAVEREDLQVIRGLGDEVARKLVGGRKIKIFFGFILSLLIALSASGFLGENPIVSFVGFAVALLLAYLSLTGSKVIGIELTQDKCIKRLESEAAKRNLGVKLARFSSSWEGRNFEVHSKPDKSGDLI